MSHPKITRKIKVIGAMIRPGQQPGSMMLRARVPKNTTLGSGTREIKEGANAFLEKRGFHQNPDSWRDMVSRDCAVAKRRTEPL